jgi:O-antigen/teichoic acid export membrane protein
MVAYAARLVGALALSILVVRSLSVGQFGLLSIARQVTQVVVIVGGLALERSLLRFLPELSHQGRSPEGRRLFWITLIVRSAAWAILYLLVVLLAPGLEALLRTPVGSAAKIGAATGIVFSTHNHVHAAATARFRTRAVAIGSTLGAVGSLLAVGTLLWVGKGVEGVLVGTAIGIGMAAIPMFVAVITAREDEPSAPEATEGEGAGLARVVRYVLPFSALALLNYAVHSQTEVFFLSRYHGADAAAFFAQGFSFSQRIIDFVPMALWEVTLAGFSHVAARDPERLGEAVRSFLVLLYVVIPPIAMLGIAFSHNAMDLLYGAKMLPAVGVSQTYFAVAAVAAAGAPIGMVLYVRERVGRALGAYCIVAVLNLGLDFWWIPHWGLVGAVASLATAKIVSLAIFFTLARRELGELSVPARFITRMTLASSPALLWLLVASRWTAPWQVMAGGVVAASSILVAIRWLRVLGPAETALIADTRLPASSFFLRCVGVRP